MRLAGILIATLLVSTLIAGCVRQPAEEVATSTSPEGRSIIVETLLGVWVQDDAGPILIYRKRYHFKPDGSYEFVFTSRNTGSLEETMLVKEEGTFTAEASRLTISPKTRPARSFPWRIEKDPYVGDIRLVMVLPDGTLDIYYRE